MADTDTFRLPLHLAARLRELRARLDAARPLPQAALTNLHAQYRLEATYHTNAIEGSTLTLRETQLVLERGLTVGGKPLRDHLAAANGGAAWERLAELATTGRSLDHVALQELHAVVMRGLSEDAGRYRTVNVRIVGARHTPPDWSRVGARMDGVLARTAQVLAAAAAATTTAGDDAARLFPALAAFHHGCAAVHPFSDGNGRVVRLATNLLLMARGWPPLVLRVDRRAAYYRALARGDRGELRPLAELLARAATESLLRHLATLGDRDALLPLRELVAATPDCPYSADYLALRARQGRFAAAKLDGVWHASRVALAAYRAATDRR